MISSFEKCAQKKGVDRVDILALSDQLDENVDLITDIRLSSTGRERGGNGNGAGNNDDDNYVSPPIPVNTQEEWRNGLMQRYQDLYDAVQKHLPNLWHSLEFELSIRSILNIKNCSLPFAGIVLGKPSSLKTVGIELFRKSRHTFYTDNFSAKSFVTHISGLTEEQLQQIDLLPKIRNRCFLTPELAPTFALKDDDLLQVLGIMTRILDGCGYENDSGAQGHRGYSESMIFTWIGAAIDIPFKVHKLLTTLGPKLYFLRVPKVQSKLNDNYYEQLRDDNFKEKTGEIGKALLEYQNWFDRSPDMVNDEIFGSTLRKMPWNSGDHQKESYIYIIRLAKLLAHLRGVVPTWHTQDTQGSEYGYGLPIIEEPDRAMQQLVNLAKGHALMTGRNHVTKEDIPLIVKVVLSTAPMERVSIFDLLLNFKGKLDNNQIIQFLNVSKPTAKRTMTEFKAVGIVTMKEESIVCNDGYARDGLVMTLKDEFDWFLTDEFKALREGFEPTTSSDDDNNDNNTDNNNNNNNNEEDVNDDSNRTIYNVKEKTPPQKGEKEDVLVDSNRPISNEKEQSITQIDQNKTPSFSNNIIEDSTSITQKKPLSGGYFSFTALSDININKNSIEESNKIISQSEFAPIIGVKQNNPNSIPLYYCKLNHYSEYNRAGTRKIKTDTIHFETIEDHCRNYEPELHKAEVVRLSSEQNQERGQKQ